jgi:hypothetical protein
MRIIAADDIFENASLTSFACHVEPATEHNMCDLAPDWEFVVD